MITSTRGRFGPRHRGVRDVPLVVGAGGVEPPPMITGTQGMREGPPACLVCR